MQAYTHFVAAILLQNLLINQHWSILIIVCYISHIPIDVIAKATYHPHNPNFKDKFWVGYHVYVALFSIFILYNYFSNYWLALIASVLMDIWDWGIRRITLKFYPNMKIPLAHWMIEPIREKFFKWLPDNTYQPEGVWLEIILANSCLFTIL